MSRTNVSRFGKKQTENKLHELKPDFKQQMCILRLQ